MTSSALVPFLLDMWKRFSTFAPMNQTVKPLTVYRASAGSGKTFRLAVEYIKLLVADPYCYRNILAVTFTNKATEEMKMRILQTLYGIAHGLDDAQDELAEVERAFPSLPTTAIRGRAGEALCLLVHDYGHFHIATIDAFFQQVLRNMAHELELNANLQIDLNSVQMVNLAVDKLLQEAGDEDDEHRRVMRWVMDFINQRMQDEKNWNVVDELKIFGKNIFKEEYRRARERLTRQLEADDLGDRLKELYDMRASARQQIDELWPPFFKTIADSGLAEGDFIRGAFKYFKNLREGIVDEDKYRTSTMKSCLEGTDGWVKKDDARADTPAHQLARSKLTPMLRDVDERRRKLLYIFKSCDLTLRYISQLRLLDSIANQVDELSRERNVFLLDNTQDVLGGMIAGSDSPFIFEKIGTRLDHIMIDEFQDTSLPQWRNFKVLLQECMSHADNSSLVVGDVKQSIYRWRDGDWRLLNDIDRQFAHAGDLIQSVRLDTNYRSEQTIVDFNNTFFSNALNLTADDMAKLSEEAAAELRRAYADVEQRARKDGNRGSVHIELTRLPNGDDDMVMKLKTCVLDLIDRGVSQRDILVLARGNKELAKIANVLSQDADMREVGVQFISDDAFRLDASLGVTMIVEALQVIAEGTDLQRAALAKDYQQYIVGAGVPSAEIVLDTSGLNGLLPSDFVDNIVELHRMPLYDLTETLFRMFDLSRLKGQGAYFCAFFDHVASFVAERMAGIEAFLRYWQNDLHANTIQTDSVEGIRLLTIHRSKGLEADNVIIPFIDWQMEKPGGILWCHTDEQPYNFLDLLPVAFSSARMTGSAYEADYTREHLENLVDNLNLLYVAFTRARKNLFVYGAVGKGVGSRSQLIERVICGMTGRKYKANDKTKAPLIYDAGTFTMSNHGQSGSNNIFKISRETCEVEVKPYPVRTVFRESNRSRLFFDGEESEESLRREDNMTTGTIYHEVLSNIFTVDDIDAVLGRLRMEGLFVGNATPERFMSLMRRGLSNAHVSTWFQKGWRVFNECTILTRDPIMGNIVRRRPDRVITDGKQMIVIDFKFARPSEGHLQQVRDYVSILRHMGYANVTGYLWYVYINKVQKV